jgi:hypothetical protein
MSSCYSFHNYQTEWPTPTYPNLKEVKILTISEANTNNSGYYLDAVSATNLVDNVSELKAYIEKLELLVKEMEKYYK